MENGPGRGVFGDYRVGVIPKARVFTSAQRDLPRVPFKGDPSLRLKNGYARDDAPKESEKFKLCQHMGESKVNRIRIATCRRMWGLRA
jgi:hypothetical protein